jgi:thiosulfate dehydrogenase
MIFRLWLAVALIVAVVGLIHSSAVAADSWTVPDIDTLPDDADGKLVRLGRELTVATYAHIGPRVADKSERYAGNNLSCQSCHLEAGTKRYGLPFVGVFGDFPQYRAREGRVGTLEDRVNGCMTRSMNGRALPDDSTEMRAFVAYIRFLSSGGKQDGRGSAKLPELTRAADPVHGKAIYAHICVACHGPDGQGKRLPGAAAGYEFPPLWGRDSFNDGAGMSRLISAAAFIHSNMPNGTTWQAPAVSPDDSWDVAAYVVSRQRPRKAGLDQDFPMRSEKPADAAYGPFADGFPARQHRFGPFAPIRARLKELIGPQAH